MTTTLEALQRGSLRRNWVVAIEGINIIFSDAPQADVQASWAGTDWASATVLNGLFVDIQNEQSADPWNPFQAGGTATLTITDDSFGIVAHRRGVGAQTELVTSINRTDTAIEVVDTTFFAPSGELHIGTECLEYSTTNGTTFTASVRGKYSPFSTASGQHFSHDHRVGVVSGAPNLAPLVTEFPRRWIGRWVGIWMHTWDENGMNSKSDALCVFAGRIAELRDDPSVLGTVIELEHVLTSIKDATVGRDLFEGTIRDGFYLPAGAQFKFLDIADRSDSATIKTANALTVVSTPPGTNEIAEGYYSLTDIISALNSWLSGEKTAGRINGIYTIALGASPAPASETRVKMQFTIPGTTGDEVRWGIGMPRVVARMLGWDDPANSPLGDVNIFDNDGSNGIHYANEPYEFTRDFQPLRMWITGGLAAKRMMTLDIKAGVPQDQLASFPSNIAPSPNLISVSPFPTFGIFIFDEKTVWRAAFNDNGDGTVELGAMDPLGFLITGSQSQDDHDALAELQRRADDPTPVKVRQVFVFGNSTASLLAWCLYSTGTLNHNSSSYDKLPWGVGVPGELLEDFDSSVVNMPGAAKPLVVFIDKATKLSQLFSADLILRRAFPVWKQGGIRIHTWQTPSLALASTTLTESNKAEPAGRKADHKTATLLSDRWAKSIIKIRYNRTLLKENGGGSEYNGTINIEDRTAVDDGGDRGDPLTIDARNAYDEFVGTGAGIEDVVSNTFVPTVPLFSQPMTTMRRSVSPAEWETLVPGDVTVLSDQFARDPDTGIRIITSRPATVIRATYSPGGLRPNMDKPEPMAAEVELMLGDSSRYYAYAPSALVTSYNSGSKTLTVASHEYSDASEDADIVSLPVTGQIRITEIDPSDPSTALTWTRAIVSKSGNDIVHDGVALASFDAGKSYRVTFDTYSAVISGQQDKAFQADSADLLIEDTAQANRFGLQSSTVAIADDPHTTLGEMYASVDVGDGKAYDVGSLKGITRLVDNLIDHKTAYSSPMLGAVMSNTTYSAGNGLLLVSISPIFLSTGLVSASVERWIALAPWFRSTDGTTTTCRVTLASDPPQTTTVRDIGYFGATSATAIFTTNSTTWSIPTPIEVPVSVKTASGIAWLVIELGYKCETRGLAHCVEQERE